MQTKFCKGCANEKSVVEFYRHAAMADGRLGFCKSCVRARVKNHRLANLDYVRWYDRLRSSQQKRKKSRLDYLVRHPEVKIKSSAQWSARNKVRKKAHAAVHYALKRGTITRKPCVKCGKKAEAHHEDYSKPLDIIWLCDHHHKARHKEIRSKNRIEFCKMKSKVAAKNKAVLTKGKGAL